LLIETISELTHYVGIISDQVLIDNVVMSFLSGLRLTKGVGQTLTLPLAVHYGKTLRLALAKR